MEDFFGNILTGLFHYWWLVVIAVVVAECFKPKTGVPAELDKFNPTNTHGASAWAGNTALKKAGLFEGKGVPIGYSPDGRHALHYQKNLHILTVAASQSGKNATLVTNALLTVKNSCCVIDPKAENAILTAHYRKRLGPVYILNPFKMFPEELGSMQARFNPMDILDPASQSFHADCDKLAAALVWDDGKDPHWPTAARMLVSGVIAALVRHGAPHEKNLPTVARIISGNVFGFCRLTVRTTTDPLIIQKLRRYCKTTKAKGSNEVGDVISTAITQLGFIGNAAIGESLSGSDFHFSDLKRKPGTTVYICLPLSKLDICDKYFRLILECFLSDLLNEGQSGKGNPVLAIIDEMAQLGPNMKSLENAMGMAAGAAGLQLWCVLQDLSQLKGMFPKTWETFIQNCGVTLWFGARDQTTREYVSKLAGATEALSRSMNASPDRMTGEVMVSGSASQFGRPLVLPHEVGELAPDQMIAFIQGVNGPVKAKRKFYFRCSEFRGKYRDNPYIKKAKGWFRK